MIYNLVDIIENKDSNFSPENSYYFLRDYILYKPWHVYSTKDYSLDLERNENADKIMESIDRLRNPIKEMTPENQGKAMKYIQNLSKLAVLIQP